MSVKLYDTDSHIRVFDAVVTACEVDEKRGLYAVEMDQTAFFAEGGGQKCDKGTLKQGDLCQEVLDVQEKDEHIRHYVKEPVTVGETIHGELDWEYRFGNMQQHSGEHILSGIMYARKGYHNVGFHLGDDVTTLDFDGPMTREEVLQLEKDGNDIVYRNLPITVFYPDAETLKQMDYRSKKELSGAVRIVKVGTLEEKVDLCACCAPHVMQTGEVGMIKIIRAENYKGGIRLTIVCGMRALRDYSQKHDLLTQMAGDLSTSIDHVKASVEKLRQELSDANGKNVRLNQLLNEYRLTELKTKASSQRSLCIVEEEGADQTAVRNLLNALAPCFEGRVSVLIPKGEDNWFFMAASEKEDMKQLANKMRQELGSKGGGNNRMIQGTVSGMTEKLHIWLENAEI